MKTRSLILKSIALGIICLSFLSSPVSATEYTKTTNKTFDVKPGVLLKINTEFGEVKARNWDKKQISVEATVTVIASSQSKADDRFDQIKLVIEGGKDLVSIISSIESGFFGKSSNNISIDFLIFYPADSRLKLKTEFGSAFFEDINGATNIDVEYGSFNANNLKSTDNIIEISFGSFQASKLSMGTIEIDYGSCEIDEANKLNLHTSFSGNVNIEKVDELILKSSYDKISIGEANTISGSTQFSSFTLQSIQKSLIMKASYGSFKVYSISALFDLIELDSEFCSLKLYVDPGSNFNLFADVELGSFNYPHDKVTVISFQKDITDLIIEGYFGSKEKVKGNMRLSVDNASINLSQK